MWINTTISKALASLPKQGKTISQDLLQRPGTVAKSVTSPAPAEGLHG
jgi:hypothetical protein